MAFKVETFGISVMVCIGFFFFKRNHFHVCIDIFFLLYKNGLFGVDSEPIIPIESISISDSFQNTTNCGKAQGGEYLRKARCPHRTFLATLCTEY